MENFVSDNSDVFNQTEKFLTSIPDKLQPIFSSVGSEGYKWLKK